MRLISCPHKFNRCIECGLSVDRFKEFADTLRDGRLVVYPTDTLYALGADPTNEEAVELMYKVKGRPRDLPVSIAIGDLENIHRLAVLDDRTLNMVRNRMPGPLTILVKMREDIEMAKNISRKGVIGIRMPNHPFALKLASLYGPITATSANIHGGHDPIDVEIAMKELGPAVDIYMDCGRCEIGKPSSVIDVTSGEVEEVRPGPITKEMLLYG